MPILNIDGPTIPPGGFISNVIDCQNGNIVCIYTPEEWTNANLTFVISRDSTNWGRLYLGDQEVTVPCGPGRAVIPTHDFPPLAFVRFRSGHGDLNVAQEGARSFRIIVDTSKASLMVDDAAYELAESLTAPKSPTAVPRPPSKKTYRLSK